MWALALLSLLSVASLLLWRYSHFRRAGLPFLAPLPLVGNIGPSVFRREHFGELVVRLYRRLEPHRCGGVFTFTSPVLMPRDPGLIAHLFASKFEHFSDRQELVPESADPLFAKSLFGLSGERWRNMRHLLSPAFTPNKMKIMATIINEIGEEMTHHLRNNINKEIASGCVEIEAKDFFSRVSSSVIAAAAFGMRFNTVQEKQNEFYAMGREITDFGPHKTFVIFAYIFLPGLMKLLGLKLIKNKCYNFFTSLTREAIELRKEKNTAPNDVLRLLINAVKTQDTDSTLSGNIKKPIVLDDVDLAAQTMIFIFGGLDTISTVLSCTSYLLATHPDVQRKLHEEIDRHMSKKHSSKLAYDDITTLKYLDMVISESLRIYPPFVIMARKCVKAYSVPASASGEPPIHVRAGDVLWLPIIALHNDPRYFPDPERFDPERFSEERRKLIRPFSYIPFGVGPRFCIANRFAVMEVKVLLIRLLSYFFIEPTERTPKPLRFSPSGFGLDVKGGLWLSLKPRNLENC